MRFCFLLFLGLLISSVHSLAQQNVKESRGVYQFLSDDPSRQNFAADRKGVFEKNGMVASAHPVASKIGVAIMKSGGSAFDAAIAVQFALAVVHPAAGNIGGGGFLVLREKNGKAITLDFREKSPLKADRDMYLDEKGEIVPGLSLNGHLASGVPGSVAGMWALHKRFGTMAWKDLLQPAVELARHGVLLTEKEARGLNSMHKTLDSLNRGRGYFLRSDGRKWEKGDTLLQPELSRTLVSIQKKGRDGFYKGKTSRMLRREMKSGQGIISKKDLITYEPQWREPVTGAYKNTKVITMGPPSSGGVALLQLLGFTGDLPLKEWGWHSDSTIQTIIEAERRVYADRAKFLGDPDFVKVPVKELIAPSYLKERWKDFDFERATDSKQLSAGHIAGYESMETTHFSVVDKEGNAVAITTTLNGSYGSGLVVKGAGFLLNNEMDDFSIKPGVPNMFGLVGNQANAIAPGKRMLSSMTPTILERDGKLLMVVGTPGGSTIITSVFQTIINVVEHGMEMQQAVNALKFHHQWLPDKTMFETGRLSDEVIRVLQAKGYVLERMQGSIGRMDCIMVWPDGTLEGASDPRGDDTSFGY